MFHGERSQFTDCDNDGILCVPAKERLIAKQEAGDPVCGTKEGIKGGRFAGRKRMKLKRGSDRDRVGTGTVDHACYCPAPPYDGKLHSRRHRCRKGKRCLIFGFRIS